MTGAKARAIIPVKVLVEQYVILPVWVLLKLLCAAIERTFTAGIRKKDI